MAQATQVQPSEAERTAALKVTDAFLHELLTADTEMDDLTIETRAMAIAAQIRAGLLRDDDVAPLLPALREYIVRNRDEVREVLDHDPDAASIPDWERERQGCDELLARLDASLTCDCCGEHPPAWLYVEDSDPRRGICDVCATKREAQDSGIVHYAAEALAHAATAMQREIGDEAETRRLIGLVVDMALDDDDGDIDVPRWTAPPKFKPLKHEVTAA